MLKNGSIWLFLIYSLFFIGCKEKPIPSPAPVQQELNAIVWQYKLNDVGTSCTNNFIYKNMIIQGYEGLDDKLQFMALTLDSGKLVWKSEIFPFHVPFNPEESHVVNNLLIFSKGGRNNVIDMENGTTLWKNHIPYASSRISIIDNKIYKGAGLSNQTLYQLDLYTGEIKTIFTLKTADMDGFGPNYTAPAKWIHPNGDVILLMGNRSYNPSCQPTCDRYDYLAYNLTADSMFWYIKGELNKRGSKATPLILDNKVVFFEERKVRCLNPLNGDLIWEHSRVPQDNISTYAMSNIAKWNNIIIAKPDYLYLYGLDVNTGQQLWMNSRSSASVGAVQVSMDKIWYCSAGLYCFDALTGKTLINGWRYKKAGSYSSPVAVDEKTGLVYTVANGNALLCLDPKLMMLDKKNQTVDER